MAQRRVVMLTNYVHAFAGVNLLLIATIAGLAQGEGVCRIVENAPVNQRVCNLTTALKLSHNPGFTVTRCSKYFLVRNGVVLTTGAHIDREKLHSDCPCSREVMTERRVCRLVLELWSKDTPRPYELHVELEDVNDNPPRFEQASFTVELNENMVEGTTLVLPTAKDPDLGLNGTIKYLLQGANASVFDFAFPHQDSRGSRREEGVVLKTLQRFDREREASLHFLLIARDGGKPAKSASLPVEVLLRDLNDNPPVFSDRDYHVTVPENLPPDSRITEVRATDRDVGSRVTISISKTTPAKIREKFKVTPSGEVILVSPLDYDRDTEQHEWIVPLVAYDSGEPRLSATASLTVRVRDVNDHSPRIHIASLDGNSRFLVPENGPANLFVARVSVTDRDSGVNGQVDCSLDDTASPSEKVQHPQPLGFRLESLPMSGNRGNYKIVTTRSFNREAAGRHTLTVVCSDQGKERLTSRERVIVYIDDKNDNGPAFPQQFISGSVRENEPVGTRVLTLRANDPDSSRHSRIRYSIQPRYRHLFEVNPNSGVVTTAQSFDREVNASVMFTAVAADAERPELNNSAVVTVTIVDVNDCAPRFDRDFHFEVEEGVGRFIGRVQATDCDTGKNAKITYYLQSSSKDSHMWSVDRDGNIHILNNAFLNREDTPLYRLLIVAKDAGIPTSLSATASVTISVLDRNDNSPVFIQPASGRDSVNISSDLVVGTVIFTAITKDSDEGKNAEVRYYLSKRLRPHDYFAIHETTGEIRLNRSLPKDGYFPRKLIISAMDQGSPQRSSVAFLTINLVSGAAGSNGKFGGWGGHIGTDSNSPTAARQHWSRSLVLGLGIGLILLILLCLLLLVTYFAYSMRASTTSGAGGAGRGGGGRSTGSVVKYEAGDKKLAAAGLDPDSKSRLSFLEFLRQTSTTSTQSLCCFQSTSSSGRRSPSLQKAANTLGMDNNLGNKEFSKLSGDKKDKPDNLTLDHENSLLYTHIEEDGSSLTPYSQWIGGAEGRNDSLDDSASNHYWVYATTGPSSGGNRINCNTYDPHQRSYTKLGPATQTTGRYNTYQQQQTLPYQSFQQQQGGPASLPAAINESSNNASESNSSEEIKRILRSVSVTTPPYLLSTNPSGDVSTFVGDGPLHTGSSYQTCASMTTSKAGQPMTAGGLEGAALTKLNTIGRGNNIRHAGYVVGSPCYTSSFV